MCSAHMQEPKELTSTQSETSPSGLSLLSSKWGHDLSSRAKMKAEEICTSHQPSLHPVPRGPQMYHPPGLRAQTLQTQNSVSSWAL